MYIMKAKINRLDYDRDASVQVFKKTFGDYGDPWGYEETLYKTADGEFFLYCSGGMNSPFPEETIVGMAADKAEAWKESRK